MSNANWTLTAESRTPPPNSPSDVYTREAVVTVLDRGLEEIFKRKFNQPWQGEELVRFRKVKQPTGKFATYRGWAGTVPLNRDADDIPWATKGEGFDWEYQTFNYRRGIKHEREVVESDDIGHTAGAQEDLLNMFKRTVEYTIADVWNRAMGAAGSQLLSDDGLYFVDSDRPNPNPAGGTWSNLEATADLTEDTLFQAYLNAEQQVSEDGNLFPQDIRKIVIGPAWRQAMWKLLETKQVLGSNYNDMNWAASYFKMEDVMVYKYLTTSAIFYLLGDAKSTDNELVLFQQVQPTVNTGWGSAENPDIMYQRLRARFGLGLGSPRKFVRGGFLAAASS